MFFIPSASPKGSEYKFIVKRGDTFSSIAKRLQDDKIISGIIPFRVSGMLLGGASKIIPGRYTIPVKFSYVSLAELFVKSICEKEISVRIPDGSSNITIAARLDAVLICPKDSVSKYIQSAKWKEKLKFSSDSLLGYLLPGEYTFFENTPTVEVIDSMLERFTNYFDKEKVQAAAALNLTPQQVVVLASIVDGETNKESEMPVIAGVYLNRLRIGMKLQADPTLQYARGGPWGRLDSKVLKMNSPYNTYKYLGLPPNAINNPGIPAINAVLNSERHEFLFFVADGTGGHTFSKTFSEHKKKADNYRKVTYGNK